MKSFLYTTGILTSSENSRFVNDTDKKALAVHKCCLEREHVSYLLGSDPEVISLMENSQQVPVFFARIEYSFGNLAMDRGPMWHINEQIKAFHAHSGQAIFVFLVGVTNHWVTVIIHKPGPVDQPNELFLLDSSNATILNLAEVELESHAVYHMMWKKLHMGLKPSYKFMVEMTI